MLQAILLAGIVAAPLGSVALFLPARRHTRNTGTWPAIRRLTLAVIGTVVLAAAVTAILREFLHATRQNLMAGAAAVVFASLIWMPVTRRWSARAHVCWASSVFLFVVYLTYALDWTFTSNLGPVSTAGGVLLWVLEIFAAVLTCAYLWEICDALGTEYWRRRITPATPLSMPDSELPMVSLHVPAHNEPPDMVIDTLRALLRLDYPRYEVILIDDNTDDEALWRPVEAWCARHGVKFAHLDNWPGYKSGALNYALRKLTSPRRRDHRRGRLGLSDRAGVPAPLRARVRRSVDRLHPGAAGLPRLAAGPLLPAALLLLQVLLRRLPAVPQRARRRHLRRHHGADPAGRARELGGWDEWCITEDAELSLRLLRAGWHGLHVDQSWGHGIMPLTFEALKGQRYRWCFGGIQILRMHWRSMLPGPESRAEPHDHRTALGLPGGRHPVVRRPARPRLLHLPAGRRGQPGHRRRRSCSASSPSSWSRRAGDGAARPGPGGGAAAPRHRRVVAGRLGAFFIWQSTSLVVARASVLALFARRLRSCARRRPARRPSGGRRCGPTGRSRRWRCSASPPSRAR